MPFKAFPLLYEFVFCMIMVSSLTNTSHIIVYNSRFNITSDNDRSLKMSPYPQQFEYIFYTLHSNWELSLMWYHSVNIFCCFSQRIITESGHQKYLLGHNYTLDFLGYIYIQTKMYLYSIYLNDIVFLSKLSHTHTIHQYVWQPEETLQIVTFLFYNYTQTIHFEFSVH